MCKTNTNAIESASMQVSVCVCVWVYTVVVVRVYTTSEHNTKLLSRSGARWIYLHVWWVTYSAVVRGHISFQLALSVCSNLSERERDRCAALARKKRIAFQCRNVCVEHVAFVLSAAAWSFF